MTSKVYFTISGMNYRYGTEFAQRGMPVMLVKDPTNEYDKEAIKVNMPGLGQVGWVANSVGTVLGDCYSAGRIYDKIGDTAVGVVLYVTPKGCVCQLPPGDEGGKPETPEPTEPAAEASKPEDEKQ